MLYNSSVTTIFSPSIILDIWIQSFVHWWYLRKTENSTLFCQYGQTYVGVGAEGGRGVGCNFTQSLNFNRNMFRFFCFFFSSSFFI